MERKYWSIIAIVLIGGIIGGYFLGSLYPLDLSLESKEELFYEELRFDWDSVLTQWNITITIRNIGAGNAIVNDLSINGRPYDGYASGTTTLIRPIDFAKNGLPVDSGRNNVLEFSIDEVGIFDHGMRIEIKLYSASGQDYRATITLS